MKNNAVQTANRKQRRAGASFSRAGKPAAIPAFAQAIAAFRAGDLAVARELAEGIVAAAPTHANSWNILGLVADREGHATEAIEIFEKALALAPRSPDLHNNFATLLRKAGRTKEAETHLKKALKLRPDYTDAAWNLGNLHLQLGRLDEAAADYRAAMASAPSQPRYPFQLAKLLQAQGQPKEAERLFVNAIELARADRQAAPLLRETLAHLGSSLLQQGRRLEALPPLYEAVQAGVGRTYEVEFARCISNIRFSTSRPEFKPLLTRAFAEAWIAPADILRVSARLLLLEPAFAESMRLIDAPGNLLAQPSIRTVMADPLLLAMMQATVVTDASLERLLTACRRALLESRQDDASTGWMPFTVALAQQCFANEYAYAESAEENEEVATLASVVTQALASGAVIAPLDLAVLASYRLLSAIPTAERILEHDWAAALAPLLKRQLHEPLAERALRSTIPRITAIEDATSEAVRDQYEENPYPRWLEAPGRRESYTLASWVRAYFPEAPAVPPDNDAAALEVLVAGCGTGQQSVGTALRFEKANVLAVDLSLASLAYAVRKTTELGLNNVTYAQGDILELGALNRKFDIVECGGVLHHLADPVKGWRVLAALTRPGGTMVIALYSEIARRDLVAPRAYVKDHGFGRSAAALRRFRAEILAMDPSEPAAGIAARRDFYSLSMVRDLAFHVQEHRFTIEKLGAAIRELGLEFCGFNVVPEIRQGFHRRFGAEANMLSLDQWKIYEEENPDTFLGMYQFLAHKPL